LTAWISRHDRASPSLLAILMERHARPGSRDWRRPWGAVSRSTIASREDGMAQFTDGELDEFVAQIAAIHFAVAKLLVLLEERGASITERGVQLLGVVHLFDEPWQIVRDVAEGLVFHAVDRFCLERLMKLSALALSYGLPRRPIEPLDHGPPASCDIAPRPTTAVVTSMRSY